MFLKAEQEGKDVGAMALDLVETDYEDVRVLRTMGGHPTIGPLIAAEWTRRHGERGVPVRGNQDAGYVGGVNIYVYNDATMEMVFDALGGAAKVKDRLIAFGRETVVLSTKKKAAWDRLVTVVSALGGEKLNVSPVRFLDPLLKGCANLETKEICVRGDLTGGELLVTMCHEAAHVITGRPDGHSAHTQCMSELIALTIDALHYKKE
jgi:hypothetical protein